MSPYSRELAPWEGKSVYYSIIQLGTDVKTQTKTISKQTQELVAAQIESTSEIISSHERISEGIDNVGYGIERVEEGIYGLKAAFEWGISEVVWQIEQNRQVLKDILSVLMAPLDTQAKELRRRAEDAYANGWFEDALGDFLESEKKNKYDFLVHISIGMIYLFQKIDKEKSLEYFEKAIKYAKPKSPYHASYALIYKALVKRDFNVIEEAEKYTDEAVTLCPDFAEALYQNALYNALLNNPAKAIPFLKKAIEMDVNYCEKIQNEKDFKKIQSHIEQMFIELRDNQGNMVRNWYTTLAKRLEDFNNLVKEGDIEVHDDEVKDCMMRITELIQRNSYRDYLEGSTLLDKLIVMIQKLCDDTKTRLGKSIKDYNLRIDRIKSEGNCQVNKSLEKTGLVLKIGIPVSIFLLSFVGAIIGANLFPDRTMEEEGVYIMAIAIFGTALFGIIITVATYLIKCHTIKSEGNKTSPAIVGIKSSIERLQDILNKLERI
ncbi:MAG: hypothetical protein E3K37_03330 [Candidatus Kuenenia sp.]|nr:hypothetical protein [Candidatus Kuenenia hertensis]